MCRYQQGFTGRAGPHVRIAARELAGAEPDGAGSGQGQGNRERHVLPRNDQLQHDRRRPAPGSPVYIEGNANCNIGVTSNATINSKASPGLLVLVNGTLSFGEA